MDQELSVDKQHFNIIKEKIIKTNELLLLYNEKNQTLAKAKHAFKQLKSKYEAALHETNRLQMENERLNYSLETLRPKYEQMEKDMNELRADYTRIDERYQQTMIESQLSISDLEQKLKDSTCEKDIVLLPPKGRSVKELKQKCMQLIETERNLKNDCDSLQLKNKELKSERLQNLRVVKDLTTKNSDLQKDLAALKTVQNRQSESINHSSQQTITSLKQNHEKEVLSLQTEISKLSLDNQRIKYLELECKNLKHQINNKKHVNIQKSHCFVQTDDVGYFNNSICKLDIGIQTAVMEPMQTLSVWEDDALDFDCSVSDILSEMILPKAVSPMTLSSRAAESPTPPLLSMFEPLPPLDGELFVQKNIPNIVITPPTPGVEICSNSAVLFPVLTESEKSSVDNMDTSRSVGTDPELPVETWEEIDKNIMSVSKMEPPDMNNTNKVVDLIKQSVSLEDNALFDENLTNVSLSSSQNNEFPPGVETVVEEVPLVKHPAFTDSNENNASIKIDGELPPKIESFNRHRPSTDFESLTKQKNISSTTVISVSACEKSISPEAEPLKTENSEPPIVNLQEDPWILKRKVQATRKFWLPCDLNSFVKLRRKRIQMKKNNHKKYRKISNQSVQSDTILSALKTLQQNHINFTISNDSIPLVHPPNYYSLLTPPKAEPMTTSRKFTNTYSDSLSCWNKQCTVNNTQMLLRKIPNEEEPELLGFFSIKSEVITPSTSRMAVVEKPKIFNTEEFVSQLLTGIKELVDITRKKSLGARKRKRAKSKNRLSDFYSETETELEKLFRDSADVLGRNRRFLAAAKEQNLESNGESMFESESDAMVDSGLVTATPKIDSDSMSFCSQNEAVPDNMFNPIIINYKKGLQDDVLQSHSDGTLGLKKGFAGFSLGSIKSSETFKDKALPLLDTCPTPKFSACPVLLSPIASSKGSPETLQDSSTPFKAPDLNCDLQASPNCFKQPFCPDMISPMASSKGSPIVHPFKVRRDLDEDSLDSFNAPLCHSVISPLALYPHNNMRNCPKKSETQDIQMSYESSAKTPVDIVSTKRFNVDSLEATNVHMQSLIKHNSTEILTDREDKEFTKDSHDKSSCSDIKNSSVCQRITFDSFTINDDLNQSINLPRKDVRDSELEHSVNFINDNSASGAGVGEDSNTLLVTGIIQEGETEEHKEADSSPKEGSKSILIEETKMDRSEKPDDSFLRMDLSINSTDLNCTLEDISISQLELSSADKGANDISKNNSNSNIENCLRQKQTNKPHKKKHVKGSVNAERRYFLRTSQCEVKNELESKKKLCTEADCTVDLTSPRTRAAKRKMEEDLNNKEKKTGSVTRTFMSAELEEVATPFKKGRRHPRKAEQTESSVNNSLNEDNSQVIYVDNVPSSELHLNCTENTHNLEKITSQNLFGSDAEDGDISVKSNNDPKQDTSGVSETSEGKGQPRRAKRLLRKRSSKSINEDISQDLFDWLEGQGSTGVKCSGNKKKNEISEQIEEVRQDKTEIILSQPISTEDLNSGKGVGKKHLQKMERPGKFTSKEFISESESECEISMKKTTGANYSAVGKLVEKHVSRVEGAQSSGIGVKSQVPVLEETDISTDKRALQQNDLYKTVNNQRNKDTTLVYDSGNSTQSNNTSNQAVTSEIQNILRNMSEDLCHSKNVFVLSTINSRQKEDIAVNARSDGSYPSEKDLFGDVSGSEDETNDSKTKELTVTERVRTKKIAGKKNLKKEIFKQVKGTVYATTKIKSCDIVKKSCEDKPVEISWKDGVLGKNSLKNKLATEKQGRKINIVQNILISKGQAFNLPPSSSKNESSSISTKTLKAVDDSRLLPEEAPKSDSKKRMKYEQDILNTSTPVDILSQVMQGMIQTGPKLARKNTSKRNRQPNVAVDTTKIQGKIIQENTRKPLKEESKLAEGSTFQNSKDVGQYLDCPKSPDVMEMPDRLPRLIPTEKPEKLPASKIRALIDKLMVFSNEEKMLDDVIKEFAFQDITFMAEIIVDKLAHDYHDKADNLFPPSPPMTSTQRILLGFLLKLDISTHPGIKEEFFSQAELRVFNKYTCTIEIVQPITRLYTALCKLRYDLNRVRRFICEGFYFIGELAVPMLFTILTMWPEVLPLESESSDHLLAKVLIQVCYLNENNQPGYNLLPLRDLLKKYYGYPIERWNCEDIFKEIMVEYIRNPSIRLSDFTILLFLKCKPTKWVYQKVQETIIPLYNQALESNPNLKATLVILLANICCNFRQYEEYDWSVILEMDKWFLNLDRDDLDPIVKRAIHLARARLPKRTRKRNRAAKKHTSLDKLADSDRLGSLTLEEISEQNCEDTLKTSLEHSKGSLTVEHNESTNDVNIVARLEDSSETKEECNTELYNNSSSSEEESDSSNSGSEIEF